MARPTIKNIAIVAHVDHGKTTLVDSIFRFAGTFRANQNVEERVLDSNPQERERGITILAKNTAIRYKDVRINIVDTPGHADFGGQVERTLAMADAVLLLVDSYEGPMPQTRFVLRKAFQHGLKAMVMINKIDRPDARPTEVLDEIFDLFVELGANDQQLEFPVVYGSGRDGFAMNEPDEVSDNLDPLLQMIVKHTDSLKADSEGPLQFQAATLDRDDFLGKVVVGRVSRGTLEVGNRYLLCHEHRPGGKAVSVKKLFRYEGLNKVPVDAVEVGDIAVLTGIEEMEIGDTLCHPEHRDPLPAIVMDEPTLSMIFRVNNSPFAGKEGTYVTGRQVLARLQNAAARDVALQLGPDGSSDAVEVKGRGVMHLSVLIENMRREGYEFAVSKPQVIIKEIDGVKCEPYELATVEVPQVNAGRIIEYMGRRRGELLNMETVLNTTTLEFKVPSRGLIGARTALLTLSQGEAVLSHIFDSWEKDGGPIPRRMNGVLVSDRTGDVVPYALDGLQDRGTFFVPPGAPVYEGMIVGANNKDDDLPLNVCREKKLTNMRASGRDDNVKIAPPVILTLEESLEYIEDDELLEVTPISLRLRKIVLSDNERKKAKKKVFSN
ncbi:MAG: translational GTPase TypA [Planctomycetes bacterium]|nr:translational GTPase TypA [Planctomycetota bacterium]MCB9909083.1 translational GTPase TypA [Planctomycetota bacterium]MCB9911670.1 translational GTPase TypA [Planctomycetota bacterium]HPF13160.1 translational GTPase TypA [Planctomycetota bacterium]HRV81285.1 translational GTPase TypA [Planctomycetota bacterium]